MRVLFFVVAILYFSFHGAKCDINFSLLGADESTYKNFIQVFRQELSIGTQKVYNLTVLKHQVALNNQRFLLVNLFNYNNDKITLGIDVFDVYVVGFLSGTNSYILKDAPNLAYNRSVLFPGSTRQNLSYTGGYGDLPGRGNIPLGRGPLDAAITNFFRKDSTSFPRAFVVVIQMVSEAARFKILESKIAQYLNAETTFIPDQAFQSLENNWGSLSKQVQKARSHNGQFPNPVELTSSSGKPLIISNVSDPFVQRGIALLKYTSETSVDNDNIDEVSELEEEEEMHHIM